MFVRSLLLVLGLSLGGQAWAQPGPRPDARGPMALPVDPQLLNDLPEIKAFLPKYFDIACRRISEAWKQPRLFEEPKAKPQQMAMELGE